MGFLVNGAERFGEPGLFVSFEETSRDLEKNFASQGFDLKRLQKKNLLTLDHIRVSSATGVEETGEYDLEGLFVRLGAEINTIKVKRVVLDTIEVLFSAFTNEVVVRSEIKRLFQWLADHNDHRDGPPPGERPRPRSTPSPASRVLGRPRRSSSHLADPARQPPAGGGPSSTGGRHQHQRVLVPDRPARHLGAARQAPLGLRHEASTKRLSTGIARLDEMLAGKGVYRGSSVLVSGTAAGTGKTSIAASSSMPPAAGARRRSTSPSRSAPRRSRNMASIKLKQETWVKKGLLRIHSERPRTTGLEMHLVRMNREIEEFIPSVTVVDPITNLTTIGTYSSIRSTLTRMIDAMKSRRDHGRLHQPDRGRRLPPRPPISASRR